MGGRMPSLSEVGNSVQDDISHPTNIGGNIMTLGNRNAAEGVLSKIPIIGGLFGPRQSLDDGGLGGIRARTLAEQQGVSEDLARQRQGRNDYADQLLKQANGTAPSLAEAQLKQAQDKTLQQQLAAARSMRGANPALLSRNLMQSQAQQGQQLAGQAAIAKLQEQQMQQNAFQNYLNSQQGYNKDLLGVASGNAQAAAQQAAAQQTSQNALFGNIIGTGGALLGTMYGGPAGGVMGSAVGRGIGGVSGGQVPFAADGGKVPGKSKLKGDDESNDTVLTLLSPGEVVVPRTVTAKSPEKIAEFVKNAKEIDTKMPIGEALRRHSEQKMFEGGEVLEKKVKKVASDYDKSEFGYRPGQMTKEEKIKQLQEENGPGAVSVEDAKKMSDGGMVFSELLKSKYGRRR